MKWSEKLLSKILAYFKISAQNLPEASPVGLRLVGYVPCNVYTPKASKQTSISEARVNTMPYIAPSVQPILIQQPTTSTTCEECKWKIEIQNHCCCHSTVVSSGHSHPGPSLTSQTTSSMLLVPYPVPGIVPMQTQLTGDYAENKVSFFLSLSTLYLVYRISYVEGDIKEFN